MIKFVFYGFITAALCVALTGCKDKVSGEPSGRDRAVSVTFQTPQTSFGLNIKQDEDLTDNAAAVMVGDSTETNGIHSIVFTDVLAGTYIGFASPTNVNDVFKRIPVEIVVKYGEVAVYDLDFETGTVTPQKCSETFSAVDSDGNPLGGVVISGQGLSCTTSDETGACTINNLVCDEVTFTAHKDDYGDQTCTVDLAGDPSSCTFTMTPVQTDGGVQDDAGQTDGGVQDDAGQSDAPPQDDAGQTDGSNSDAPTPGTIVFKCVKAGSSPLQPLQCTVTEVNLGTNLHCSPTTTDNDGGVHVNPYGVCEIDGLTFGVSLRFTAAYTGCTTASWPSSGSADPVVIMPAEPRLVHEFALSCP